MNKRAAITLRIEFPSQGQTYCREEYGVYEYSVYPRGSVLEGEERRTFIDAFPTLEEALNKYPSAERPCVVGSGYTQPSLDHLPGDDDTFPWHPSPECPCNLCQGV